MKLLPNKQKMMNPVYEQLQWQSRRHFLTSGSLGLGSLAMAMLSGSIPQQAVWANELATRDNATPMKPMAPPLPAKAKRVIYLHMAGSPSQLELWDHKPALKKWDGQECPKEYLEGKRFAFIKGVPKMLAPIFPFTQQGQSGQWMSDRMPHLAKCVDDIAVIRSMSTDQFNHSPAQLLVHTGQPRLGNPSMGAWATYGLGSENQDLPGFVVLLSGGKTPDAGKSLWGSGFLPSVYQGVQCRTTVDPVFYLSNPAGVDRNLRRETLDALREMNQRRFDTLGDPETLTRIAQYELAYRMQVSVPGVMDLSQEPQHILDLYGAKPGFVAQSESETDPRTFYKGDDPTFANNCLLARRLIESGVRFVQVYDWGWDHHGASPGESIDETLPIKCQQIDRAIAGLITDLKQRGLLDETLIVWGGEFGRTPMAQNNVRDMPAKGFYGRDHHPYAFSMWMAGGGIKGGVSHGQTDDIGYYITQNKTSIRDLQATILHLLGFDPYRFSYAYQGLNNRLIGPTDEGKLIQEILL
jgi:hypothetical protein